MAPVINKSASIAAADSYSAGVVLAVGDAYLTLSGTFVANVVLQSSNDDGGSWSLVDVRARTGSWPFRVPHAGLQYRFGCRVSDYVFGTVVGAITQ